MSSEPLASDQIESSRDETVPLTQFLSKLTKERSLSAIVPDDARISWQPENSLLRRSSSCRWDSQSSPPIRSRKASYKRDASGSLPLLDDGQRRNEIWDQKLGAATRVASKKGDKNFPKESSSHPESDSSNQSVEQSSTFPKESSSHPESDSSNQSIAQSSTFSDEPRKVTPSFYSNDDLAIPRRRKMGPIRRKSASRWDDFYKGKELSKKDTLPPNSNCRRLSPTKEDESSHLLPLTVRSIPKDLTQLP